MGLDRKSFAEAEIVTLLIAVMANEGARIVEEQIAESDAAIDVVKTAGYGFPRHKGGPMHWAQSVGEDAMRDALQTLETASPNSWVRAKRYR